MSDPSPDEIRRVQEFLLKKRIIEAQSMCAKMIRSESIFVCGDIQVDASWPGTSLLGLIHHYKGSK